MHGVLDLHSQFITVKLLLKQESSFSIIYTLAHLTTLNLLLSENFHDVSTFKSKLIHSYGHGYTAYLSATTLIRFSLTDHLVKFDRSIKCVYGFLWLIKILIDFS